MFAMRLTPRKCKMPLEDWISSKPNLVPTGERLCEVDWPSYLGSSISPLPNLWWVDLHDTNRNFVMQSAFICAFLDVPQVHCKITIFTLFTRSNIVRWEVIYFVQYISVCSTHIYYIYEISEILTWMRWWSSRHVHLLTQAQCRKFCTH